LGLFCFQAICFNNVVRTLRVHLAGLLGLAVMGQAAFGASLCSTTHRTVMFEPALAEQALAPFARFSGPGILRVLGNLAEFLRNIQMGNSDVRGIMALAAPDGGFASPSWIANQRLYFADGKDDASSGTGRPRRRKVFLRLLLPVSRRLRDFKHYKGDMSDILTKALTHVRLETVPVIAHRLPKGAEQDVPTTMSIDPALYERLGAVAEKRGISRNALVNAVLAHVLGVHLNGEKDERLNLGAPPIVLVPAAFAAIPRLIARAVWSYEAGAWFAGAMAVVVATSVIILAHPGHRGPSVAISA
jgi:hypothetical protein